jgi:hypothetical protein
MVYAIVTKQYGFIFGALAYGSVHAKNAVQWRNDASPDFARKQQMPHSEE